MTAETATQWLVCASGSGLPPVARARVLLVVLGSILLVLVGLVVLTVMRRWFRRVGAGEDGGPSRRVPASAWTQAGRRAVPEEAGDSEDGPEAQGPAPEKGDSPKGGVT